MTDHTDDGGGPYNPDGYGCRKPVLALLAMVLAAIAIVCF